MPWFQNQTKTGWKTTENFLLWGLITVHLLPIWLFRYFPSQDGPAHVHNAEVLKEYFLASDSFFQQYYTFNPNLAPNWFSHIAMAGLMTVVSPITAEKFFLSSYVILLPLAVAYTLGAITKEAKYFVFLSFPFIFNITLHLGFYNFSYSLILFFFLIGYWLRYQQQPSCYRVVVLGLLSLLLYGCHIFSLITAYVAIAILLIWQTFWQIFIRPQLSSQQLLLFFFQQAAPLVIAFFPSLLLVAQFILQKPKGSSRGNYSFDLTKLWSLLRLDSLASYDQIELLFSIGLVCLLMSVTVYFLIQKIKQRQLHYEDGWLAVFVGYVVIYFVAPAQVHDSVTIKERMMLYPYFALILWLGAKSYRYVMAKRIQLIAIALSLFLLGVHTWQYAKLNGYLKEYLSGAQLVETESTLLTINFSYFAQTTAGKPLFWQPYGRFLFFGQPWQIGTFIHAAGYLAAQRHSVYLNNYAANLEYFPINFQSEINPFNYLYIKQSREIVAANPAVPGVDIQAYEQQTTGKVDYVLLWQLQEQQYEYTNTQAILAQLNRGYELIYTSPNRGLLQLYRRRS
ncbi:MAG: hypothetical protein ACFB4I_06530 [Cyanophyceae cyanobacterium]